jgi:glycosyltransferase involved in cell wall biosynthesis
VRVAVLAEYYPRRRDPVLGVWAHRQALAARDAGAEVIVLALERPLPPVSALRSPAELGRAIAGAVTQPRRESRDGLEVEYVRFLAPPRERSYANWDSWARGPLGKALARAHEQKPLDLVHAHYALPSGAAALAFTHREELPLAISVHGGDVLGPLVSAPAARARVGEVLGRASLVLCNSHRTLERCAELTGNAERMTVVYLGADAPAEPIAKRPESTIATLAHLIPRKRHADVLRALALLAGRLPELRWLVIGDGPERPALERLAAELGVAARVDWTGQLPHDDALTQLAGCRLMVLPSVDEAFGVAYIEALACGVPAIGCRGEGGPEEIAAAGRGTLLVPPRDPEALAAAIAGLLEQPERLDELSRGARATAAESFTWERCGKTTVEAYRRAIAEGPR